MKILYVEDNPANLFLVKRIAKIGSHEVVNYVDGQEALDNLAKVQPDLVMLDIQLSGELSGLDVVRKMRADGQTVPVIAVTAYAMVGDKERCLEAGCNEYLAKPLPIPRLVELLKQYDPSNRRAEEQDDQERRRITDTTVAVSNPKSTEEIRAIWHTKDEQGEPTRADEQPNTAKDDDTTTQSSEIAESQSKSS